ncbi:hypothetical protein [Marilutibacter alkalisoli]|uniref:PH domain-containing protein n=1 Tax=Marilutibacter alkalisoli TaxID=2591633 RepID=A0A514BNF8_9GAMM|nr:hypothetical protein [Lysobacter alkalisoli]QDH68912.1 hypothetical protein FKV23_01435 [Lysobacter alkalisoli]
MSASIPLLIAVAVLWGAIVALPERVRLRGDRIVVRRGLRLESIAVADIRAIRFHYHAVVGFVSVWELVSRHGCSLMIEGRAWGARSVLGALEVRLPGFSLQELDRQFEQGDVEDTLELWRLPRSG